MGGFGVAGGRCLGPYYLSRRLRTATPKAGARAAARAEAGPMALGHHGTAGTEPSCLTENGFE